MSDFIKKYYQWVQTDHEVDLSSSFPNISNGRLLAHDEPSPGGATDLSRGHPRLFIPNEFEKVGSIRFGSATLAAPGTYRVKRNYNLQGRIAGSATSVQVLHGSKENVEALLHSIKKSEHLTQHSTKEGLKTGAQNACAVTLQAGSICILVGGLVGGPVGAGISAGAASILGVLVGGVTGIAQTTALRQASEIEREIQSILGFWMDFLNGDATARVVKSIFTHMHKNDDLLRKAKPDEIHRMIFDSLNEQLDEILSDEGRMGILLRRNARQRIIQGTNVRVERTRAFDYVLELNSENTLNETNLPEYTAS